jgi:hypothetical protein
MAKRGLFDELMESVEAMKAHREGRIALRSFRYEPVNRQTPILISSSDRGSAKPNEACPERVDVRQRAERGKSPGLQAGETKARR